MTEMIEPMPAAIDQAQLARELVERARAEGVELVGPGGLLTGLTKTVLETTLEGEMTGHLGLPGTGRPRWRQLPQRHPHQDGADRDRAVEIEVRDRTAASPSRWCTSGSGGSMASTSGVPPNSRRSTGPR